jgi:hypothetical protein
MSNGCSREWDPENHMLYNTIESVEVVLDQLQHSLVSLNWFLAFFFIKWSAVQWVYSIVVAHHCWYQWKLSWIDLVIMPSSLQKSESCHSSVSICIHLSQALIVACTLGVQLPPWLSLLSMDRSFKGYKYWCWMALDSSIGRNWSEGCFLFVMVLFKMKSG